MMFNVPQYIDVEDKIAGPFTAKQLGWMFGMGAILLVLYNIFDLSLFAALGLPIAILFIALAFYRPNGQPFAVFIYHAILFLFRPKVALWERPVRRVNTAKVFPKNEEVSATPERKRVSAVQLEEIARLVDRRG